MLSDVKEGITKGCLKEFVPDDCMNRRRVKGKVGQR